MEKLLDKLKKGKILVSDGAWGTFLQQKGLKPGECPELWNIEKPEEVYDIAFSYAEAGSDMIETNSFGANRFKLEKYGLQNKAVELNVRAAEISRRAAGNNIYVLGSMGPSGKLLMMDEVTPDELYNAYKEQSMALEAGGADAIVIETMTDLDEARMAVRAARENTKSVVICTMTFDKDPANYYFTMMGISPADMVKALVHEGASIIGANCGNGIAGMIDIVKEIRKADREIPVLVHANAGMPVYAEGLTTYPETPSLMAGMVKELIVAGANIIGGCCGTTPLHISEIKKAVELQKK